MTETAEVSNQPTEEQIQHQARITQMKQNMCNTVANLYQQFLDSIRKYPGQPFQSQQALIRFDEGHMWLQQAIINSSFEIQAVPTPSQDDKGEQQ